MGKLLRKYQLFILLLTATVSLAVVFLLLNVKSQDSTQFVQAQATNKYYVTQSGSGQKNGSNYANAWSVVDWNQQTLGNNHTSEKVYFCGLISDEVKIRWGGTASGHFFYEGGGDGASCTAATIDRKHDADDFKFAIAGRDQAENISYYTIQNFKLKNVGGGPTSFNNTCVYLVDGDSHHIVIDNVSCTDDLGVLHQLAAGIDILGPDYIQIKNCTFTDMGIGISLRRVDYYNIYNNTIIRPNYCRETDCRSGGGIAIGVVGGSGDQCNYGRILNNTIEGYYADTNTHSATCLQVARANHVLLKGNILYNCGQPGHQFEGYDCGVDNMSYVVAEDNVYYNNGNRYQGFEPGVWIDEAQHVVFQRNRVYNNNMGVNVTQNEHVIFRYNLIFNNDNTTSGTDYYPQGNTVSGKVEKDCPETNPSYNKLFGADNIFYNNTWYDNGRVNGTRSEWYLTGGDMKNPIIFKNNIMAKNQHRYAIQWRDSLTGKPQIDYNYYFDPRNPVSFACDIDAGGYDCVSAQRKTWTEWVNLEGQDTHSTYSTTNSPLFTDPDSGDFTLLANSPVINKGANLTQTSGGGTGITVRVEDARYFTDNMDIVDGTGWQYTGDIITIGNDTRTIVDIDYINNIITVDQSLTWTDNEPVNLKYDFAQNPIAGLPDIGAYEYQQTQITCLAPDLDCDKQIDIADHMIFKNLWGTHNPRIDFNQTSFVGASDYAIMMSKWGDY